jgi:hypothetical protein
MRLRSSAIRGSPASYPEGNGFVHALATTGHHYLAATTDPWDTVVLGGVRII